MSKQFIAILVVIVIGLFSLFALTKDSQNADFSKASTPTEHTVGSGPVKLIEFGDFQCPACAQYFPIVNQVKEEFKDRITFQFSHFPLTQIHPFAFEASRAAEAAGKQGKFFEMHDLLYQNQESWTKMSSVTEVFEDYARQLELDIDQYKTDLASEETAARINADIKLGQSFGANSTPTFVLNGEKLDPNPRSFEEFKTLLEEEIAKASQN